MTKPIQEVLDAFEPALAAPVPDYDTLIGLFRALVVPADVTARDLTRLYTVCYRLLGIATAGPPVPLEPHLSEWRAGHLVAVAADVVERTMVDRDAKTRAWIARRIERLRARGRPIPEGLDDSQLPPRLVIPFDARTAAERIRPYLDRQEANLATEPAGHFKFCWDVARLGYPVFQPIVHCWAEGLEARGIGVPGTVAAIGTAGILLDRAEKAEPRSWSECQRDVLPLLDDPHPMVAAGAGRWLGALCAAGVLGYPDAPDLATLLNRLAERPVNRAAIAGGFVNGFDTSGRGLASLTDDGTLAAAGFDLDDWIVACLAPDETPPYIPNAQALWFHVHEHYAADPAFVARLIDHGHAWIAMMCATEIDDPVEGMGPVLERLAADPDPNVAETARRHLARHY